MMTDRIDSLFEQIKQQRPLDPAQIKNLEEWYRSELTYTSNAIEGNTLTRQETALVIEKGLTIGGKTFQEHQEATNHAKAYDWLVSRLNSDQPICNKDILAIHELILKGIDDDNAGRFRTVSVRISGSTVVLPNYQKVPDLMQEFEHWLQDFEGTIVELAIEAHYRFVTIHPFTDGNGRTARLLMNLLVMAKGFPPIIILNEDRLTYIESLEKAQLGNGKSDYEQFMLASFERSLEQYLDAILG